MENRGCMVAPFELVVQQKDFVLDDVPLHVDVDEEEAVSSRSFCKLLPCC